MPGKDARNPGTTGKEENREKRRTGLSTGREGRKTGICGKPQEEGATRFPTKTQRGRPDPTRFAVSGRAKRPGRGRKTFPSPSPDLLPFPMGGPSMTTSDGKAIAPIPQGWTRVTTNLSAFHARYLRQKSGPIISLFHGIQGEGREPGQRQRRGDPVAMRETGLSFRQSWRRKGVFPASGSVGPFALCETRVSRRHPWRQKGTSEVVSVGNGGATGQ